jgi:hypothetical protein
MARATKKAPAVLDLGTVLLIQETIPHPMVQRAANAWLAAYEVARGCGYSPAAAGQHAALAWDVARAVIKREQCER